ncbi:MAG TPA: thiol:disulfide interchange protein DsbA/DsbL [Pseudomonadales bacterium]|nr:thiol:disulfide interchange protein DsbA/DsbL [Pseudomonadales bacterium]
MVNLLRVLATAFLFGLATINAWAEDFVEGKDYVLVKGETDDPAKIEVREFFWYGCPHCYHLEADLEPWVAKLPADVAFVRTPGAMVEAWKPHARAFFVAQNLGIANKIHTPLFDAIHKEHRQLMTDAALQEFLVEQGADRQKTADMWNSFLVNTAIHKADQMARNYQLEGVPTLIINGKYMTDGSHAGNPERLFKVVDFLIAKERAELKKK